MTRLINADALKKHYAWWEDDRQKLFDSIVDSQPTVDAAPVRHGRWISRPAPSNSYCGYLICSNCGEEVNDAYEYNYCPHCGARMDEE